MRVCALACVCLGGDKAMAGTKEPTGTEPLDGEDEKFGSANTHRVKQQFHPRLKTLSLEDADRNGWKPTDR